MDLILMKRIINSEFFDKIIIYLEIKYYLRRNKIKKIIPHVCYEDEDLLNMPERRAYDIMHRYLFDNRRIEIRGSSNKLLYNEKRKGEGFNLKRLVEGIAKNEKIGRNISLEKGKRKYKYSRLDETKYIRVFEDHAGGISVRVKWQ